MAYFFKGVVFAFYTLVSALPILAVTTPDATPLDWVWKGLAASFLAGGFYYLTRNDIRDIKRALDGAKAEAKEMREKVDKLENEVSELRGWKSAIPRPIGGGL